jgi:hypothetical protein
MAWLSPSDTLSEVCNCGMFGEIWAEELPLFAIAISEVDVSSRNYGCASLVRSFLSVDLRRNLPNLHRTLEALMRREGAP